MRAWQERPPEIAALLNPAFCALVLREAVKSFTAEADTSMPFPLIAFILPLSLHAPTRQVLPSTIRTKMHVWMQEYPEARIQFAPRARGLLPYAREALLFAAVRGVLTFDAEGNIAVGKRLRAPPWERHAEPAECLRAAGFVGRWLARAGEVQSIFIMWGVRP
ncbi:three component ABC system middle component [Archangium violaceum]|uniref:three component ABC system middle component n=1 Tax=Archangium violaceum TaxID=83451 RepID=UPI0035E3CC4C